MATAHGLLKQPVMTDSTRVAWFARTLGAAALMVLGTGCYAETGVAPAYVEANAAPVNVDVAPQYAYEGRTVYYVNDRWYARDRGSWVYYRKEPDYLYRRRTHVIEAPRARDHEQRHAPAGQEIARPRRDEPHLVRVQ